MATTRTKACLRVSGDQGSTAEITEALGLSPSRCHDIGRPRSQGDSRPWPHVNWTLDSDLPDAATLEEHLNHLCDQLQTRAAVLQVLHDRGYHLDWFCLVEIENGQGGVPISPDLLRRLAHFPIELDLDIYA